MKHEVGRYGPANECCNAQRQSAHHPLNEYTREAGSQSDSEDYERCPPSDSPAVIAEIDQSREGSGKSRQAQHETKDLITSAKIP